MSDKNVINVMFPKNNLRKLYDEIFHVIEREEFDSLTCVDVVGILEMVKFDYMNSIQEDE